MKHVKLFEEFDFPNSNQGTPASNLSDRNYWKEFDYMDGETADEWAGDPGYRALERNLGSSLDNIIALNSENDDVEDLEERIENSTPSSVIPSNQEYITSWEYYPELSIAVAFGNGGAPDWFFIKK